MSASFKARMFDSFKPTDTQAIILRMPRYWRVLSVVLPIAAAAQQPGSAGKKRPKERWDVGQQIRDVAVGPDGAVWMIENANSGGLFRVTPNARQ
jgi:glucose/arabinose dehydrogenase